jgi:hypothetical protein
MAPSMASFDNCTGPQNSHSAMTDHHDGSGGARRNQHHFGNTNATS